jgi:transcriptional regulator with XRE-family HTH domain
MINEQVIITARQDVGKYLQAVREEKKLTYYAVAKLSDMSIEQVQGIESGDKAYTFDSFLKIIYALDCSLFLEDKDGKHPRKTVGIIKRKPSSIMDIAKGIKDDLVDLLSKDTSPEGAQQLPDGSPGGA